MNSLNGDSRVHPLDEWLSFEQESISKFKKEYPDVWSFFGECINLARAIPYTIGQQEGHTEIEMHRLFLWQKVLHYQTQSLFLLLQSQLDAGFALLRLASELSRDVIRIADDKEMLAIWTDREDRSKEYRNLFKFDANSPDEELVFNIYKFASKFGVHGHMTDTMFSEAIGSTVKDASIISFGVSNIGILDAVHMWMMSFLPMHHICAKSFMSKYFVARPEIFLTLRDYEVKMNLSIQTVAGYLENMRKK
jgi:hypothetical protein